MRAGRPVSVKKNILVVDGAENCAYDIFAVSKEKFERIFPGEGQNIAFIEDVKKHLGKAQASETFKGFWDHWLPKSEVRGIHGILFYELELKKQYYPNLKDSDLDNWARPDSHADYFARNSERADNGS